MSDQQFNFLKGKRILVTGGSGFIGINLINYFLKLESNILNIDKVKIVNSISNEGKSNYKFERLDLLEADKLNKVVIEYKPNIVIHLAAESHVDRSISNPENFIYSNIIGTFNLLEASRKYFEKLNQKEKYNFRFHHVSTDEVFGSVINNKSFCELDKYYPTSPYSASKASSDHLVNAWHHTYNLPVTISNCSNNYGKYQFPDKLIPTIILKAINKENIPLYGDGNHIRDWLYVDDHIKGIINILNSGEPGRTYCIGGNSEKTNKEVVLEIFNTLNVMNLNLNLSEKNINYVQDRLSHDRKYSVNSQRIEKELDWRAKIDFKTGIISTVKWYVKNINWCKKSMKAKNYNGERLGLI